MSSSREYTTFLLVIPSKNLQNPHQRCSFMLQPQVLSMVRCGASPSKLNSTTVWVSPLKNHCQKLPLEIMLYLYISHTEHEQVKLQSPESQVE